MAPIGCRSDEKIGALATKPVSRSTHDMGMMAKALVQQRVRDNSTRPFSIAEVDAANSRGTLTRSLPKRA